jgi:hypothetical protein
MPHRGKFFLSYGFALFVFVLLFPAAQMLEGRGGQTKGTAVSKQTFTYKVVEGCQIQADVYRVPDTQVRPAIVEIRGGALIVGDRNSPRYDEIERYVRAGYVVVSIDYRLAPEAKLKEIFQDIQDAYAWGANRRPSAVFDRSEPDRRHGRPRRRVFNSDDRLLRASEAQSIGFFFRLWRYHGALA